MVHNRVTPNLLMVFFLAGGLFMVTRIKQEVFPEFELDQVNIQVRYPGASPEEVERGILTPIETQVRGVDGVKKVLSTASEGVGVVLVELFTDIDRQRAYQDIKQAVDRIITFPKDAERPEVNLVLARRPVLSIVLFGDVSEWVLRDSAELVRDRLLHEAGITQIIMEGARDFRVTVEVPQATLQRHGLTLQEVANRISLAAVELPGGKLETRGGQVLLRVNDRRDWARQYAQIPIVTTPEGAVLRLEDLAKVREGFLDANQSATFDNKRGIVMEVFRVAEQTPKQVARDVRKVLRDLKAELPPGVDWRIRRDRTEIYSQRLELLLKNAVVGLLLVLLFLGLFLDIRLAFWVTLGIPTAFLGALLFLPIMDVSINMMSMFAFIIALGIVVDDAIVAGENIYEARARGLSYAQAAIVGAKRVSVPIAFAILTNVVAFFPIYFMLGEMGKVWKVVPLVVITVFLISWVESLIILPAHLAHGKPSRQGSLMDRISRGQQRIARLLELFVAKIYAPFLDRAVRWRGVTVSVGVALLVLAVGYVFSGRIGMILMPRVESDMAVANAVLRVGASQEQVDEVRKRLVDAAHRVGAKHGGTRLMSGVSAVVVENQLEVRIYLRNPKTRPLTTQEVVNHWRKEAGPILGLESLRYAFDAGGPGSGAAITVELSHPDTEILRLASETLAARLAEFPNVKDIDDGFTPGKEQISFRVNESGQSIGLTSAEIGRQVRNAFYGAEPVRQVRDRNEMRVLVRFPEGERLSEGDVERLLVTTPSGQMVPFREVAEIQRGRAYTTIERRDGRRTVTVTADVAPLAKAGEVLAALNSSILPEIVRNHPGLTYRYEGRQAEMRESTQSLWNGFLVALGVMFFLLAIPFRSYIQPLVVMVAIPFGVVGAVLGHMLMGYALSLMSLMGIVALSGVVVNDSLVLIDYANSLQRQGRTAGEAIREACIRRFRPVILTTLTTFGGLAPMIFETSRQARFMIPMAISLGFGILFATVISLVFVPCLYRLLDDLKASLQRFWGRRHQEAAEGLTGAQR
jgi:multidrug efflux pump subunit AcrB